MSERRGPWLTVLGIGDGGIETLTPPALGLLKAARALVASGRVLGNLDLVALGLDGCETVTWSSGLGPALEFLTARRGTPVTVLATGDPMHFGIGVTLTRMFAVDEMRVIPAPSGFSLAAARLGWPLDAVACLSLHGRDAANLVPHILPGNRILAATAGASTVHEAAAMLAARGYGESPLTVLEHVGGEAERTVTLRAGELGNGKAPVRPFAGFNMLAIACVAARQAVVHPPVAGLPDSAFVHDGQMTKRAVRAVTLAMLAPCPGALLWDVGAGCGSVAIEWLRAARGARAVAVEAQAGRAATIAENAVRLGVPSLEIVGARAPGGLDGLDAPDAVFIGGGLGERGLFECCWRALKPGGRLVANAVTLESEARLVELSAAHGGALTRLSVAEALPVGGRRGWRAFMPVVQWAVAKPWQAP